MKMAETVFVDGRPVGQIVQDNVTGVIAFRPKEGISPPSTRLYSNVDELRAVLQTLYGDCRQGKR